MNNGAAMQTTADGSEEKWKALKVSWRGKCLLVDVGTGWGGVMS